MKFVCKLGRHFLTACIVAAATLPPVTIVHAQVPSSRPLVIRVAYPAGGPADVAARKIQVPLQAALGKPVIIENLPGAGGSIAANNVLTAAPDGQTLLVTTGNDMILSPLALSQVKYKPEQYRLLATILPTDFTLVTSADHAFSGIDALIERARKSDQKELTIGSWGHGSAPYLVGADFSASTNAHVLDVPYKGAAPVIQALLSREIDMAFVPLAPNVLELIRTGKINAIGVANTKRNPYLPKVPTLSEGKYLKNFVYSAWAAVFVPASVPEPVAASLHKSLAEITGSSDFQSFLKDSAALPVEPMTPVQSAAFYQAEIDKFRRIAKAVKLEPQ
ncbi:tripartite tricarboxylate transporter substrate binding protein [Variovorax sp. J22G21]|uniref:tripartite tricarboxylate transporter substrate binding protein n=1 Tax=Variovorax fucosicus TaxID=3053517 RepID=UPI002575859C|nr:MULTISPECIES: tripartite tricarboxylate transporter substrate binding protein [unclassified Variovorax]MDM0037394.1 tripartite tricarboxylate transporter substrate binding protein [Variovorax sp. J22R193]MDM0062171.1 tripartite tricarboxylate transporter substrate binding protein [Variovorax sp. J22G21]